MFHRIVLLCLSLASICSLAGCGGSGLDTVPAGGVVTLNGTPIAKISVAFMPKDGKGQIAEGVTDEQGKFELQTREPGDGALAGEYLVSLRAVPDEVPQMPGFPGAKPPPSPIPLKYGDTSKSGFNAKVEASGKNEFTFDLKS